MFVPCLLCDLSLGAGIFCVKETVFVADPLPCLRADFELLVAVSGSITVAARRAALLLEPRRTLSSSSSGGIQIGSGIERRFFPTASQYTPAAAPISSESRG